MYSRIHEQLYLKRSSTTIGIPRKVEQAEEEEGKKINMNKKLMRSHSSHLSYRYRDDGIPDFLLEPMHELPLLSSTSRISCSATSRHFLQLQLNSLLIEFFNTTVQASTACASLLLSIDRARSHHRSIHHLLHKVSSTPSISTIFSELSFNLELENPLSPQNLPLFYLIHSQYPSLICRLNSTNQKIGRRLKLIKFIRIGSGMSLFTFLSEAVVTCIVIASHKAATGASSYGLRRRNGWLRGCMKLDRAKAKVDAATKGAYIVGRDLDTMSQMLRRVHDEVEHERDVARMVVRNKEWEEVMRGVVKEMEERRGDVGLGFEEQLEELEEHVYLCLITINRSRRLVAREMIEMREESIYV